MGDSSTSFKHVQAWLRQRVISMSLIAAAGVLLIWHSLQFNFVTDDAFISFVYARNLAEHGELVFNLGDRVEGFTNLLWTVLLSGFMALGAAPETMSQVLGAAFSIGTLIVAWRLMAELWRDECPWNTVPSFLLATCAGYACWTSGGLETQLFTFLCTTAFLAYLRYETGASSLAAAGIALALAALTRPEGVLVTAVVAAHLLVWNTARNWRAPVRRGDLIGLAWFLGLWLPVFAWRWYYYGYPFPNTYYVKAAGEVSPQFARKVWENGGHYLWQWARHSGALYAAPLALVGAFFCPNEDGVAKRFFGTLALALVVVYLVYAASVGGDFMGLHRFVMPVFVLVALLAACGLRCIARLVSTDTLAKKLAHVALGLTVTVPFAVAQNRLSRDQMRWGNWNSDRGIDTPAFLWVYTHDRGVIGRHMQECMEPTDFSILGGAGAKPYYGRMRGIDVFGLVSERIAHELPPTDARAGHNKWASNQFLRDHDPKPNFIFSCYSIHREPGKPAFNCQEADWTRHGYERVTLHIPGMKQQGEYYSFFKAKDRDFVCPGLVE